MSDEDRNSELAFGVLFAVAGVVVILVAFLAASLFWQFLGRLSGVIGGIALLMFGAAMCEGVGR